MSTSSLTAPAIAASKLQPVSFARLLGVQLRIWRSSRAVLIAAASAVLLGVCAVAFAVGTHRGVLDADAVGSKFDTAEMVFSYFWPIIGAVAGASAFTSRWALVVLVLAPRRGRWLLANLTSFLLVPAVTVLVFLVAAFLTTAALGADAEHAAAVFSRSGPVLTVTVVNAAAGFLLGFALRSVTVAIVAVFLTPLLLPLVVRSNDVIAWLSLDTITTALSSGTLGSQNGLPIITAALLWLVAPAYVAWMRLRSSAG